MAAHGYPGQEPYSQLEIVPHEQHTYSRLEVVPTQPVAKDIAQPSTAGAYPVFKEHQGPVPTEANAGRSFWRRWAIWLILFGLVLVGAVVGGTVGGLHSNHRSAPPAQPTGNGTPTITASSQRTLTATSTATATMSGTATVLSNYLFPTAVSWGYPHLEVFALSDSDIPYWKWKNSSTSDPWNPQGNSLESLNGQTAAFENGLAAIARGFGIVDIFCAGTDDALYHKYHSEDLQWGPSLSDWENRGGGLTSPPTVVSWAEDRLDIFVIGEGPSYSLFQQFWDTTSGWSSYVDFGGTWSTFAPTAVSWGLDRIDLFLVDPVDKSLHHIYWDGSSWQPPNSSESLGGYCTSRPIAVSWASGRIDIFVRGGDAGLWHLSYSDGWSSWTSISGNTLIQAEPDAVSWGPNHLDVLAWGVDSSLLHKSYDGTTDSWSPKEGFEVVGQGLQGPPKAVSDGEGSVHVFCYTQYGELSHKAWNQTQGSWTPSESFDDLGVF